MTESKRGGILPKKKRGSRNENWRDEETDCLVSIWSAHIEDLVGVRRPGKIYEKMAAEFAEHGYTRKSLEIQKKVSNLSQEYRKEEKKIRLGHGPSNWKFFNAVENIILSLTPPNETFTPKVKRERSRDNGVSDDTNSQSDNSVDDVTFMAVFLKENLSSESVESPSPSPTPSSVSLSCDVKMPVIVSVCGNAVQHADPVEEIKSDLRQMKAEMDEILEENLQIQMKQDSLRVRCIFIQQNMVKLMDKLMDY